MEEESDRKSGEREKKEVLNPKNNVLSKQL